jgi:hypothetical protein
VTDLLHQIRNNWFDKGGCIIFHAFWNTQQTFDSCPAPNNRNEALFGSNVLLRNFRHVIWICGPARIKKLFKKNQPSFLLNMCSNLYCWFCSCIWRSSRSSCHRDPFSSASSQCGTERKLNFSKCRSSWSRRR